MACEGAQQFLKEIINDCIKNKNMDQAVHILDSLYKNKDSVQEGDILAQPLEKFLLQHAYLLFDTSLKFLNQVSKELLLNLVKSSELNVDEIDLFKWLINWGEHQLKKQGDTPTPETLRNYLEDILPLILFEHMGLNSVVRFVQPTKLFSDSEMLEIYQAITFAQYGQEYKILNRKYEKPRQARQRQLCDMKSAVIGYRISKADILRKTFLPPFQLYGSEWFVRTCFWGNYLSVYLYNKIIYDGGSLSKSITTRINFKLINKKRGKDKVAGFTKEWANEKAWGYSNFIELNGLYDPANGWVSEDDPENHLELEIAIERV